MLAELHCHSVYSKRIKVPHEGMDTPKDILTHAKSLGIGAIAISDHDEFRGSQEAVKLGKKLNIIVIPAQEVTTTDGHMLALGIQEKVRPGLSALETIDVIHQQGGISIAPHAFDINNDGLKEIALECDAMEAFNSINVDRISNFKALNFAISNKMPMVAGSDAHCLAMMGGGLTRIDNDVYAMDDVLTAIKRGRVSVGTKKYVPIKVIMDWSMNRLKLSYDFVWEYIDENYSQPKKTISKRMLTLVNRYPGRTDFLFKSIAYFSLGSVIAYSAAKEIGNRVYGI